MDKIIFFKNLISLKYSGMSKIFTIVFLTSFCLLANDLDSQNELKKFNFGITLGIINWSKFYDSEFPFSKDFLVSTSVYPMIDFLVSIPVSAKIESGINISNIRKLNTSIGWIPYKLDYVTLSPFIGISYINKGMTKMFIGTGPYLGYIYNAKKGNNHLNDEDLKKFEYGLEFLVTFKKNKKNKFAYLQTIKIQYGMNDVLFFKTFTISGSLYGLSFNRI